MSGRAHLFLGLVISLRRVGTSTALVLRRGMEWWTDHLRDRALDPMFFFWRMVVLFCNF